VCVGLCGHCRCCVRRSDSTRKCLNPLQISTRCPLFSRLVHRTHHAHTRSLLTSLRRKRFLSLENAVAADICIAMAQRCLPGRDLTLRVKVNPITLTPAWGLPPHRPAVRGYTLNLVGSLNGAPALRRGRTWVTQFGLRVKGALCA